MNERELEARYDILLDRYSRNIQIESRILGEMALNQIVPAAIEAQNKLIHHLQQLQSTGISEGVEELRITVEKNARHIKEVKKQVYEMIQERKAANNTESTKAMANAYCKQVKPYFDSIRYHIEKLELNIDDQLWPVPKYRELLFMR